MKPCNKGDLGEISVIKTLLSQGLDVYRPVGNGTKVDLVVGINDRMIRVQVKCTSSTKDGALLNLRKNTLNPKYNYIYSENDIDVFALYVEDWDAVAFITAKEVFHGNKKRTMVTFRKSPSRQKTTKVMSSYSHFPSTDL